jgi:hypothetical protein
LIAARLSIPYLKVTTNSEGDPTRIPSSGT